MPLEERKSYAPFVPTDRSMDGFRLVKLNEVIRQVDIVITCTGSFVTFSILDKRVFDCSCFVLLTGARRLGLRRSLFLVPVQWW